MLVENHVPNKRKISKCRLLHFGKQKAETKKKEASSTLQLQHIAVLLGKKQTPHGKDVGKKHPSVLPTEQGNRAPSERQRAENLTSRSKKRHAFSALACLLICQESNHAQRAGRCASLWWPPFTIVKEKTSIFRVRWSRGKMGSWAGEGCRLSTQMASQVPLFRVSFGCLAVGFRRKRASR
jgi:hypothetical protein